MKVTRSLVELVGMTVKQSQEYLHSYDIEKSFRVKKLTMLKRVIER